MLTEGTDLTPPFFCAVPVVVGNNKDEGNLITIVQFPPDSVVPQNLSKYIQRIAPPPYNVTVASQYDLLRYTPFGAISTIVTDQQFLCHSERALHVLAQAGMKVYRFVFMQVITYLFCVFTQVFMYLFCFFTQVFMPHQIREPSCVSCLWPWNQYKRCPGLDFSKQ
jgi:hypothetical protein